MSQSDLTDEQVQELCNQRYPLQWVPAPEVITLRDRLAMEIAVEVMRQCKDDTLLPGKRRPEYYAECIVKTVDAILAALLASAKP